MFCVDKNIDQYLSNSEITEKNEKYKLKMCPTLLFI